MIATVTVNPAFDKICYVDDFAVNKVQRVVRERTVIGGKGVNISVMLRQYGIPSIAMGFVGGILGTKLELELRQMGITTNFVRTEPDTRTNIFIIDSKNDTLTVVNVSGQPVSPEDVFLFRDRYLKVLKQVDTVILAGSLPPGLTPEFYGELVEAAHRQGVRTMIHAEPKLLGPALASDPFLVFPDMRASGEFLDQVLDSAQACAAFGKSLLDQHRGIEIVLFSHLVKQIIAVTRTRAYVAGRRDLHFANLLGFSDAIAAGLIWGLEEHKPLKEALRLASLSGYTCLGEQDKFCPFLELMQAGSPLDMEELEV